MERQTLAVVLRTADYKDNDKMLTLLTKQYGRMSANARGAKKQTSKLFSSASLFSCGDYSFYEKDGRYGVKSCAIQRTFFNLQNDYDAFSAACFIADAVDKVAQEDDVSPGLFSLTVHALYALDTAVPPRLVLCYFLQRLLKIEGVYPCLNACVLCGAQSGLGVFSAAHGGAVCAVCARAVKGAKLDEALILAMRSMARTTPADMCTLKIDTTIQQRLCGMLVAYLEHVLQRPMKTARFVTQCQRQL